MWDVDAEETTEDLVTTSLFEAVDRSCAQETKKSEKHKKKKHDKKTSKKHSKKRKRSTSSTSTSSQSSSSSSVVLSSSSSKAICICLLHQTMYQLLFCINLNMSHPRTTKFIILNFQDCDSTSCRESIGCKEKDKKEDQG